MGVRTPVQTREQKGEKMAAVGARPSYSFEML